jgi:hypothetical protein
VRVNVRVKVFEFECECVFLLIIPSRSHAYSSQVASAALKALGVRIFAVCGGRGCRQSEISPVVSPPLTTVRCVCHRLGKCSPSPHLALY